MPDLPATPALEQALTVGATAQPEATDEQKKSEKFWITEINRADEFRRKNREPRWRRARKEYQNLWFYDQHGKRESNFVKNPSFYSHVSTLVANITSQLPNIIASASSSDFDVDSYFIQAAIKNEMRRLEFHKIDRQIVLDSALYNIGIVKTGYNFEENWMLDANAAFISRISPFNYLLDVEADSQRRARWEGDRFFMTLEEFKAWHQNLMTTTGQGLLNYERAVKAASKRVVNSEMDKDIPRHYDYTMEAADTNARNKATALMYDYNVNPAEIDRVEIYHIWDKVARKEFYLVNKEILVLERPMPSYILDKRNKSPYSLMQFNKTSDYFYGESDHSIFESKFYEIDEITNRLLEFTKRMIPKVLIRKGAFTKTDVEKLCNGRMLQVLEVMDNFQGELRKAMDFIEPAQISQENQMMLDYIIKSLGRDSGIDSFAQGAVTPTGRKTATEIQAVQQGAGVRAKMRINEHDDFLDDTAHSLYLVMREMYDGDKWISEAGYYPVVEIDPLTGQKRVMTGPDGEIVKQHLAGFKLAASQLKGGFYNIKVEAGSTSEYNNYVKQQSLLNTVQLIAGIPMLAQLQNWQAINRKIARSIDIEPNEFSAPQQQMQAPVPGAPPAQAPMTPETAPQQTLQAGPTGPGNMTISGVQNKLINQLQNQNAAQPALGGANVARV